MTLTDPHLVFKVTAFLKPNISKKVTTAHSEETIPNKSNGAMFGDLRLISKRVAQVCQHQLNFFCC